MKPVVLDTCVLIAGLIGQGASARLVDAFFADRLRLVYTPTILAEYVDVMERPKFRIAANERLAVLMKVRASAMEVDPVKVSPVGWPDPKDVPFVAAALAAGVKIIVTLNPRDFAPAAALGIEILSPAEALRRL